MRKLPTASRERGTRALDLARVLLVHGELAPRLTLQTILQAGGYAVDVAATEGEAVSKLDEGRYELVLSDSGFGGRPGTQDVLAYARVKDYRPATAVVTSYEGEGKQRTHRSRWRMSIYTENVQNLLGDVADLIAARASRRYRL